MNRRHAPSRRNFLKALGVGPALLPLLQAETALAVCAGVSGPQRVFILVWPNGMLGGGDSWATAGDTFTLPPQMASLQPHRQDLILMDGLDYKFIKDMPGVGERTGEACFPGMLTGAFYGTLSASTSSDVAGGISIDQYIGNKLRARGFPGLVSLNLAVQARSTGHLSWKAPGVVVLPNVSPLNVFSTLFMGPSVTPTFDKIQAMRMSILDHVADDLNRFAKTVGGTEDRAHVAAHLENVRALEQRLAAQTTSTPATTVCAPPAIDPSVSPTLNANFELITKLQIDLSVAAFAADATRVVVLQLGDQSNANVILTSLGFMAAGPMPSDPNTGDLNGLHSIARRNGPDKIVVDTWFMSQLAYAIGALKNVTDGGGTMLNNTALLAMSNMRSGLGEVTGVPAILAGSCGGYFKTGRSLSLTNTPNNGVLIALANAMGIPTLTFGETIYGGELTVLKG